MALLNIAANILYANREFYGNDKGYSYNGLALLPLLKSLSIQTIGTNKTFEGYSVWEIVGHLAFYKHFVSNIIDQNIEAYPFDKGTDGFFSPATKTVEKWHITIEYLESIHKKSMDCLSSIAVSKAKEKIEVWNISLEEAAIWLCAHDTYHIAQINNMNVPGIKSKKLGQ